MRCSEIMRRDVKCAVDHDTVRDAARLMRDANVGFLPVCNHEGKVIGTLTDRDIVTRAIADRGSLEVHVRDVMTKEAVSVRPDDPVELAERVMRERQKSRVICMDDEGRPAGVISLSDLVKIDEDDAARTLGQVARREARP